MRLIKLFSNFLNLFFIVAIIFLGIYMISSKFDMFGGYKSFLVQSGSMEPAIMTGDIILVQKKNNYSINDTITFSNNSGRIVTHRIVAVEDGVYSTKGDANRTGDEDKISYNQVIGKVVLVIPKIGYLVAFCKTLPGLIILVLIPVAIYILDELLKLKIKNVESQN